MQIRGIAFDLDGTLVSSSVDFVRMKREMILLFGSLGLDESLFSTSELTYTIMDRAFRMLSSNGVSERGMVEIAADITRIMNRVELASIPQVEAMPGVIEVISELKDRGIKIGVITRSCRAYTIASLERIGVSEMIDAISARDDVEQPKPHPSHLLELADRMGVVLSNLILVGDHPTDYECAKAANVAFIGVPSRSLRLADSIAGDPNTVILDSLWDLPSIILNR